MHDVEKADDEESVAEHKESSLRLFCAIELPKEVRAQVATYIATLREAAPRARASWDREEKLHLTLKFFGDVEENRLGLLTGALRRAASLIDPFELKLSGTGAFPPSGSPRVLWLGVTDASGSMIRLHQQIEDECARSGFAREHRRFRPHLTIARLRSREGAGRLAALHKSTGFETPAFKVTEIVLIRSELLPQGSRYTTLEKIELKARAEG